MIPNYLIDPALRQKFVKGTSGNANGKVEYIGEASPDALTSQAKWRIKKIVYDSAGFTTDIIWADGTNSMNKIMDTPTAYTYSTS